MALWDPAEVGRSHLGCCTRADVLESRVRVDDRPREHAADGASGGGAGSDKRSVDGVERPAATLRRPSGGSSGPTEGAMTPSGPSGPRRAHLPRTRMIAVCRGKGR
jgi:hypothetical protein